MIQFAWNQCPNFKLTSFPQGLSLVFPNFQYFYLKQCGITEFTGNELAGYPNLLGFAVVNTKIAYIPNGLFQKSPNIYSINLSHNQIVNVASNAFEGLPNLQRLEFFNNPCFSRRSYGQEAIAELIGYLDDNCPPIVPEPKPEPPVCTITTENVAEYACQIERIVSDLLTKNGDLEKLINDLVKQVQAITNN